MLYIRGSSSEGLASSCSLVCVCGCGQTMGPFSQLLFLQLWNGIARTLHLGWMWGTNDLARGPRPAQCLTHNASVIVPFLFTLSVQNPQGMLILKKKKKAFGSNWTAPLNCWCFVFVLWEDDGGVGESSKKSPSQRFKPEKYLRILNPSPIYRTLIVISRIHSTFIYSINLNAQTSPWRHLFYSFLWTSSVNSQTLGLRTLLQGCTQKYLMGFFREYIWLYVSFLLHT